MHKTAATMVTIAALGTAAAVGLRMYEACG